MTITRAVAGALPRAGADDTALRSFLRGLPPVDQVGVEQRAAVLWSRSIKTDSKRWALDTSVSMVDLTTLEGNDTPGKVRTLCVKAVHPDPTDPGCPRVAAVCLYPDLIAEAVELLAGTGVAVASVATAFPSGRSSRATRLADVRDAVDAGANEIDMVIDRGAFLSGRYAEVFDDIVAVRAECGDRAHLKVILETGELATYDNVYRASWLALAAGGDFIKTSTGKISPSATPSVAVTMLSAVRDFEHATGERRGVKLAGGIRSSKDALRYLVAVKEVAGEAWLTPHLFRFGASSLLNDLLMQRMKLRTGAYSGPNYVTVD
ncbi:MAG TPA: deoxyribose-phosphate aldolase [Mycobacteriales bacterium]|nr:deoxyribose-phosphate aldolase [Mycobacteriales bacterium]